MAKPYLFIVAGRPGSGKTTFAKKLARAACLPVLSRDELKEGWVHTQGMPHSQLPPEANGVVTDLFFSTIGNLLEGGVSLIAEAAFQHGVWNARVQPMMDLARVRVLICSPGNDGRTALERFLQRGLSNPQRGYFHGDKGVQMAREGAELTVSPFEEPRLNAPTYHIDTSDGYRPGIEKLLDAIWDGE